LPHNKTSQRLTRSYIGGLLFAPHSIILQSYAKIP
jgi:hypothetical protein